MLNSTLNIQEGATAPINITTINIQTQTTSAAAISEKTSVTEKKKRKRNNSLAQSKIKKYGIRWNHWIALFPWIQPSKKGSKFVTCKLCLGPRLLSNRKASLMRHSLTKKHIQNVANADDVVAAVVLTPTKNQSEIAKAEIKLSLFLVQNYSAFKIIEQLQGLVNNIVSGSKVARNVHFSKTKATAILKHVTGGLQFQNLCSLMRKNKFSVIIDTSSDADNVLETKNVCVVVRISNDFKISDLFYTLFTFEKLDAKAIYDNLVASFNNNGIDYKTNLIGFCSKDADVMMARNSSVLSYLKVDVPNLLEVRCIRHSSHDSASLACSELPQSIEDLFQCVVNYIQTNRKRIPNEFQEIFEILEVKSNTDLCCSQTRLLSRIEVVNCLLKQYELLKKYFRTENALSIENILDNLNNPVNYLYLCFLSYGLTFFTNLNDCMESEKPKIHTMFSEIESRLRSLLKCYLKNGYIENTNNVLNIDYINERNHLPCEKIYFGTKVNECLGDASCSIAIEPIPLRDFRLNCLKFYVEGSKQMFTKYNLNINKRVLRDLDILNSSNVVDETVQSIGPLLQNFPNLVNGDSIKDLDIEWRKLPNYVRTVDVFKLPEDMEEFWTMVGEKKLNDRLEYPHLTKFVFEVLSLPHSSAKAERTLTKVNLIKSEVDLETDLIVGLLLSNDLMGNQNCFQFEITKALTDKYFENQLQNQNI